MNKRFIFGKIDFLFGLSPQSVAIITLITLITHVLPCLCKGADHQLISLGLQRQSGDSQEEPSPYWNCEFEG
jgi:hypothetical protein